MKKFLVADDSSTIQKVIKIAFSKYSVKVIEASSYIEALRSAAAEKPDAIIVDANLVGANGPLDLKKIQDSAGGAPILVLAGSYESVNQSLFHQHGLQNILQKPFDTRDIINKIIVDLKINLEVTGVRSDMAPPPQSTVVSDFSSSFGDSSPELRASIADAEPAALNDPFETLRRADISLDIASPFLETAVKGKRAFSNPDPVPAPTQRVVPTAPIPTPVRIPVKSPDDNRPRSPEAFSNDAPPQRPPQVAVSPQDAIDKFRGAAIPTRDEVRQWIMPHLREELTATVKDAVRDYCDQHFNEIAKELILQELRRLAEEKSKHLTDH
jgi:CheY-like chemotaxis protein